MILNTIETSWSLLIVSNKSIFSQWLGQLDWCWIPLHTKNNEARSTSLETIHGCQLCLSNKSTARVLLPGCMYLVENRTNTRSRPQSSHFPAYPEYTFPKAPWPRITTTKTHGPINSRIRRVSLLPQIGSIPSATLAPGNGRGLCCDHTAAWIIPVLYTAPISLEHSRKAPVCYSQNCTFFENSTSDIILGPISKK